MPVGRPGRARAALVLLACASCLSAPGDPVSGDDGGAGGGDGGPGSSLRVVGVFERDAFGSSPSEDDLAAAVVYQDRNYILHLHATGGGLPELLGVVAAVEIPFEPVAMTGADADGDNVIDLVAVSADGELAVLGNSADGLVRIAQDVVVDSGNPLHEISAIEAPDLDGEERIFVAGVDGIWMSDPLGPTGEIHFDEINPRMQNVAKPAAFWAGHDDLETWYVGFAHGTNVDMWTLTDFDRGEDLISYQATSPPAIGLWRRFVGPPRINFFGVVTTTNRIAWVEQEFGSADEAQDLDMQASGPLRDITVVQQPEGYDLIAVSEEPEGVIGLQVAASLTAPTDVPVVLATIQETSIETGGPFWVRAASVTATPYAGREMLVFDPSGHLDCFEFDAGHAELTSCGQADLREHIDGWTRGE